MLLHHSSPHCLHPNLTSRPYYMAFRLMAWQMQECNKKRALLHRAPSRLARAYRRTRKQCPSCHRGDKKGHRLVRSYKCVTGDLDGNAQSSVNLATIQLSNRIIAVCRAQFNAKLSYLYSHHIVFSGQTNSHNCPQMGFVTVVYTKWLLTNSNSQPFWHDPR